MSAETMRDSRLEIAHVLFIDIVGYSKLLTNEQRERMQELNRIVRETGQFRTADAEGKLIRIPTGDGMVLAFFTSPDAPVRCAVAISRTLHGTTHLPLRMGVHSGPVDLVEDVNNTTNLAGAGVNMAQRVMSCGDAGHILLSARAADDLAQYAEWKLQLHDLGEVEVKHGMRVRVANLYSDKTGNAQLPQKLKQKRLVRRRRIYITAGSAIIVVFLAGMGFWNWQRHIQAIRQAHAEAAAQREKSVAVLPFENLSSEEQNAIFAGGVHREVLTNLAKVADLKVISRDSVMRYKPGTDRNLKQIADELGVNYVVEATVQREANHIHVTVELINTRTQVQAWAETYDGNLSEVISFQSDIAQRITNQLGAKLSPREATELATAPTHDMAAFEDYIRARALMEAQEDSDVHDQYVADQKRATQLLEQAIARDPQFALAYCALTEANIQLYRSGDVHTTDYRDRAERALNEAQRLASQAGEAIYAHALVIYYGHSDFKQALATLEEAAKLLPNNYEVTLTRGFLYRRFGRWQEAYAQFVRACELNPREPMNYAQAGMAAWYLRWWDENDRWRDQIIKRFPQRARIARLEGVMILRLRGDVEAGNKELDELNPDIRTGFGPLFFRAFWRRDYVEARRLVKQAAKDTQLGQREIWLPDALLACVGQADIDWAAAVEAEKELEKRLGNPTNNDDAELHETLALVKGILGKKQDAIHLREQWWQKHPVSADYLANTDALRHMVYGYVMGGDRERAIKSLETLVQIPGGIFYGELKYNPIFDSLRKEPRFDQILKQSQQPFPRF